MIAAEEPAAAPNHCNHCPLTAVIKRVNIRPSAAAFVLGLLLFPRFAVAYDPLAVPERFTPGEIELSAHDSSRARDIPLRVYLPGSTSPAPVVLFSHGLGGSRNANAFLGRHWAARGYVAVFMQHPGSDERVWKDEPAAQRRAALRKAASARNLIDRAKDVHATLDALAAWHTQDRHPLAGRVDVERVGMSGHSFGALTTQAASGQSFPYAGTRLADARIKAAVLFSPSAPRRGSAESAFRGVTIPWLLMTGTKDSSPIGGADVQSRLAVYPALRSAPRYELVLQNAEHSAFSDRALPGDREPRNPNHHRVMVAFTTAFWDAYLRDDPGALAWLRGPGAPSLLEREDRWRFAATD
jgi:predicted dienelactone hydrolase